jgi:hypothetical protein
MSRGIRIESKEALRAIGEFPNKTKAILITEVGRQSDLLAAYIIERHLTGGPSHDRLARRSGHLARTTRALKVVEKGDIIHGGIAIGAKYASTHFGKKGKKTTIRPKKAKALAIPIASGLTLQARAGRTSSPRSIPGLVMLKKKGKNPILAKIHGDSIEPYFVLVKKVVIEAKVDPDQIASVWEARLKRGVEKALEGAVKKI